MPEKVESKRRAATPGVAGIFALTVALLSFGRLPAAPGTVLPKWVVQPVTRADSVEVASGLVSRRLDLRGGKVLGRSYRLADGSEFMKAGSPEFAFRVDGKIFHGLTRWKDVQVEKSDAAGIRTVRVRGTAVHAPVGFELTYTTYPGLALVRKTLAVVNKGGKDVMVEDVDVETFRLSLFATDCRILRRFARYREEGDAYIGNWNDPLVVVHDYAKKRGIAVGNEGVAVMKRTTVFQSGDYLVSGTPHVGDMYPFRKWLKPGETWRAMPVFTAPYSKCADTSRVVEGAVSAYVRRYMGVRVERIPHKPLFVYNTWDPFRRNVNAKLVRELADAAAECGVGEFVIDDGWQVTVADGKCRCGDWAVDEKKFPGGLKPVFDYIRSKGMKPGVWLSLAWASDASLPVKEHPEWFTKGSDGKPADLHVSRGGSYTACMATPWREYIRDKILALVKDHGLQYVKLDLAIATSAYVYDVARSGCSAADHRGHRGREDSFDAIYAATMSLFDELHAAAPDLFIDCTFETAGKHFLMDYGIAKHADGNWLSNITASDDGRLCVRNLAWGRTPALPPASLVIGNLFMNGSGHLLSFKSLAGTLPIMLGDPRKLSTAERAEYKAWSGWLKGVEARHGFMSFRQDIPGFGEPREGAWDGFLRINTETKSGGLVGVFRQNAVEETRRVSVRGLDPSALYSVRKGVTGEPVAQMSGRQLETRGFEVVLPASVDGELFEVSRVPEYKSQTRWLDVQAMVDAAAARGGGVVRIEPGVHEVKPFRLKSNVTLEIPEGARILASTNIADYASGHGKRVFLSAVGATNIAIVGKGTIDGRGAVFKEVRIMRGEQQPQALPVLIRLIRCRDVRLEDFHYTRPGSWACHLQNCDRVTARRLSCFNHVNKMNDGFTIESTNVLVEDCDFDADDDALCFKTESDKSFAVSNVVVRNCRIASCCNGIKFGTGSYNAFRNITIENCTLKRARMSHRFHWWKSVPGVTNRVCGISGIALEVVDGGQMDGVTVRNIEMTGFQTPIFIRHHCRHEPIGHAGACLRNVLIENVRAVADSRVASSITGVPRRRPRDITLRNIEIVVPGGGTARDARAQVPEMDGAYPESLMFGRRPLPAYGFYVRHADNVKFDNVKVVARTPDACCKFVVDDAEVEITPAPKADEIVTHPPIPYVALDRLSGLMPVRLTAAAPVRLSPLTARHAVTYVVYADAARTLTFAGRQSRIARFPPCAEPIAVTDERGGKVCDIPIPGREEASFSFKAPARGFYRLSLKLENASFLLTEADCPVAIDTEAMPQRFIYSAGSFWLSVPPATDRFAVDASGFAHERLRVMIADPKGAKAWARDNISYGVRTVLRDPVPGLWRVTIAKPSRGVLEDVRIDVAGIPGLLLLTPDVGF